MAKIIPGPEARREHAMRDWAGILNLWHVCDNASCRRARVCRGNVRACFGPNVRALPEGVQDWFWSVADAQDERIPFDEFWKWMETTPEAEAFREWNLAVNPAVVVKGTNGAGAAPEHKRR